MLVLRTLVLVGCSCAIALVASSARAQTSAPATASANGVGPSGVAQPSVGLPQTRVIPTRPGDVSTVSSGLPLNLGMMPLRLSLSSGFWPQGQTVPDCAARSEQSGNSWNFFPQQRAAAIHIVPSLTLVGFSTTMCPFDANAGVGLVYIAPIRRDVWLVGSAGTSILPTSTTVAPVRVRTDARLDVVWKATPASTFTFGIGRRGVSIGGAF